MFQLKLQEFEFIRNNTENIFFVARRQSRASTRNSLYGSKGRYVISRNA
jgi:hypothetical protein